MAKRAPGSFGKVVLRDVTESDVPIFFEQQRDSAANYMAGFTARDPSDRDSFMKHWASILADNTVIAKTVLLDGDVAGSVASWVDVTWLGKPEVTYWIGREYWGKGVDHQSSLIVLGSSKGAPHLRPCSQRQFRSSPSAGKMWVHDYRL